MNSKPEGTPLKFDVPIARPIDASNDQMAESEAAALAFDLPLKSAQTAKRIAKLGHKEKLDGTVNHVLRIFIWAACFLALMSFAVLFYHLLMPDSWLFLTHERIITLREFLFSGTFGAGLTALWSSQSASEKAESD